MKQSLFSLFRRRIEIAWSPPGYAILAVLRQLFCLLGRTSFASGFAGPGVGFPLLKASFFSALALSSSAWIRAASFSRDFHELPSRLCVDENRPPPRVPPCGSGPGCTTSRSTASPLRSPGSYPTPL